MPTEVCGAVMEVAVEVCGCQSMGLHEECLSL